MTMPRYSSRAMSQPASTSTRRTVLPSGPVWIVTSFLPSRSPATACRFVGALDELHAALLRIVLDRALAAAAGVDLGLHDGERAAQLVNAAAASSGVAATLPRHGDAGLAEQLFGLVFVDFHCGVFMSKPRPLVAESGTATNGRVCDLSSRELSGK